MSQQQSVMVVSEIEFRVSISGDTDLESVFDALADELASLEDATMGLLDSTVSMDANESLIAATVTTEGDTFEAAAQTADSAVRAAVHAAGGATPGWDAITVRDTSELVSNS
ncbi:hypothetical protein [Brevibacterium otitidis]|uniref:Uncharacterized protein n=1 Tax=Brevibacterium otitidis TaxID=53364 RepID=A0ABV5X0Q1_9MICO|nr:hypothetical protein GCM10023233_08760 [Brevibacterium otitidis]